MKMVQTTDNQSLQKCSHIAFYTLQRSSCSLVGRCAAIEAPPIPKPNPTSPTNSSNDSGPIIAFQQHKTNNNESSFRKCTHPEPYGSRTKWEYDSDSGG